MIGNEIESETWTENETANAKRYVNGVSNETCGASENESGNGNVNGDDQETCVENEKESGSGSAISVSLQGTVTDSLILTCSLRVCYPSALERAVIEIESEGQAVSAANLEVTDDRHHAPGQPERGMKIVT